MWFALHTRDGYLTSSERIFVVKNISGHDQLVRLQRDIEALVALAGLFQKRWGSTKNRTIIALVKLTSNEKTFNDFFYGISPLFCSQVANKLLMLLVLQLVDHALPLPPNSKSFRNPFYASSRRAGGSLAGAGDIVRFASSVDKWLTSNDDPASSL